ncbi:MAG: hypothetical protein QM736_07510 [Vicinamibacterales bacterium]
MRDSIEQEAHMDARLQTPAQALRLAIGLIALFAGLDKFFDILADWDHYVSPVAAQVLPFSTHAFMQVVGVVELAVGIAILTTFPVIGAYVASAWLLLVAVNLMLGGFFDVAVRDVVLSIAAVTVARLSQVQSAGAISVASPAPVGHHRIA